MKPSIAERAWRPDPARTLALLESRTSDRERWGRRGSYDSEWRGRSELAASLLPGPVRLLDLGAGEMHLETLLPEGSVYIPADLEPLDARCLRVDLNEESVPRGSYHVVSLLGVAEYLFDLPRVLREIRSVSESLLMSYCCVTDRTAEVLAARRKTGWANAYANEELVDLARRLGWGLKQSSVYNEHKGFVQRVFLFH